MMFPLQSRRVLSLAGYVLTLALTLASALTLTCGSPVRAQAAAVTVNDESITEDEIDQRTKLNFVSAHKQSVRQDVINELADDKDNIKEAEKHGVDLGDAQVDNAFTQMCSRMHLTQEQLKKSLEGNGVNLDTLRNRIKADMARASLIQLRYNRFRDRPLTR
jgi:peptidyl-prolyl cis-trans isomerase SurA